ncbi:MAG: RdgB/HAM1 family non-canonical purine NTP pyrophosphatase [Xanthomonadales bacterium]|nr:RdgB/HAM1 family non-canonical purine NTP pyrophosphatase [Xanthomonadales bacterium]
MTQQPALVIASGNPGKLRELQAMLQSLGWKIRSQDEWNIEQAEENGLSFVENALIKARHAAALCGLPALGDDSGLVVDALAGAPGIRSARYAAKNAGEHADDAANNQKLLAALQGLPKEQRAAHFYCAMVFVRHASDPAPLVTLGQWHGNILTSPRGTGGFGYDPLFWLQHQQCASAELSVTEKNRISHRGQALAAMVDCLKTVRVN